ncbi:NUDIX hydrolase [Thermodesulfobacteriota bacterium]
MNNKVCSAGTLFQERRILLGKRSADRKFYPNVWDLFGGHSEKEETPEETLIRECQGELGIILTKSEYLTLLHDPDPEIHGGYEYYIY